MPQPQGIVILNGPLPPSGDMFCAICAGTFKHAAIERDRAAIQAHERSGQGIRHFPLPVPDGQHPPALAVAWGIVPQLGAALPQCWTHLAGIDLRTSPIIPAAQGPVLLDGSPRQPS